MYKMADIAVEKYTDVKVHTIRVGNKKLFWVKMCDVQTGLGVQNISDLVRKEIWGIFKTKNPTKYQIRKYKRNEKELDKNCSKSRHVFVRSDLMTRIIKISRGGKKIDDFRSKLAFKLHDITMNKEESVTEKTVRAFSDESILTQHSVLSYQIDLYFPKYKLAIEVDRKGHIDRDKKKKNKREEKINEKLGCKFTIIIPDAENYDIFAEIGKIQNRIIESTKNLTKKSTKSSLIDKISRRPLELEFEENHSIKSKCLKFVIKKISPSL